MDGIDREALEEEGAGRRENERESERSEKERGPAEGMKTGRRRTWGREAMREHTTPCGNPLVWIKMCLRGVLRPDRSPRACV